MSVQPAGFRVVRDAERAADAAQRARRSSARDEAARILVRARDEADAIRARAREEGLASVAELLHRAQRARLEALDEFAEKLAALALEVAAAVLGHDAASGDVACHVARRALARVSRARRIVLRVHPDDVAQVAASTDAIVPESARSASVAVEGDAAIARGGAMIETEIGRVDARIETQLAAIASAWRVEP